LPLIQARILKTGDFSDLNIKCNEKTFAVHKSIICPQSSVLNAALFHDFKVWPIAAFIVLLTLRY